MQYSQLMNRIFAVLLLLSIMSCTARINGSLQGDGQADLYIYAQLEPGVTGLIRRLAAISGAMQPGAAILDGPAIAASMSAAPGISSASFKNTTQAAIEGPVKIARISDFLAPGMGNGRQNRRFITFEQTSASAGGKCTINLSLDTGPEILALISPEISSYLSALMAPIATGEALTKAEYLMLVGAVYGPVIANEISRAFINASIDFPGPVQSVKGGTFSGRRAEFAIPLLDILVLETPLSYEVDWQPSR
jgi:hypothetical protein